jgi:hypothetical protein
MRYTIPTLLIAAMALSACPAPGPTGPGVGTTGQTVGTMTVPAETNPAIALAPMSPWQLAAGTVIGLPAYAAALDASVVTQFKASIDGKACPVTWDQISTNASGETKARFTVANLSAANKTELILSSPSGSVKLGTWLERVDPQTTVTAQTDVSARSTAGLLVCRSVAANGGKAVNQYSQAEFQAVVANSKTAEVETSLKTALSSSTRGQDCWTAPTVAQVTLNAAADVSAALNLGAKIQLGLGGSTSGNASTTGGSATAGGTITIGK